MYAVTGANDKATRKTSIRTIYSKTLAAIEIPDTTKGAQVVLQAITDFGKSYSHSYKEQPGYLEQLLKMGPRSFSRIIKNALTFTLSGRPSTLTANGHYVMHLIHRIANAVQVL